MNSAGKILVHVDKDLQDLIPEFLEGRRADVDSIGSAVGARDYETVRVLGHSMKGCGGGYGFEEITEIGAGLEQAAKAKDEAAIFAGLEKLADYLARVEVVYEEL
jgi:HPt (histidine-containing phosphotransfer) domain-containing protein